MYVAIALFISRKASGQQIWERFKEKSYWGAVGYEGFLGWWRIISTCITVWYVAFICYRGFAQGKYKEKRVSGIDQGCIQEEWFGKMNGGKWTWRASKVRGVWLKIYMMELMAGPVEENSPWIHAKVVARTQCLIKPNDSCARWNRRAVRVTLECPTLRPRRLVDTVIPW